MATTSHAGIIQQSSVEVPSSSTSSSSSSSEPIVAVAVENVEETQMRQIQALQGKIRALETHLQQSNARIHRLETQLMALFELPSHQNHHHYHAAAPVPATTSPASVHELEIQTTSPFTTVSHCSLLARQAVEIWQNNFGDIGPIPDLPFNMEDIWNSPCPFWPPKRVCETHILTLIPSQVNGQPYTLNLLGDCIQNPCGGKGYSTKLFFCGEDQNDPGNQTIDCNQSYWILMTSNVLDGSRKKTFADQNDLVSQYAGLGYKLPSCLEATTTILLHYVQCGERLLSDAPWTSTRCRDWVSDGNNVITVGGFGSSSGLFVCVSTKQCSFFHGVAGCRKL